MGTSLINDGFFIAMIAGGHSNPRNGSEIVMNSTFSIFLGVAITCYNHGEPTSSVGFFLNNPSPISATWNKWLPSRQGLVHRRLYPVISVQIGDLGWVNT